MAERSFDSIREELGRLLPIAAVGVLLGVTAAWIVLPHPVEPVDVPLPTIDWQALSPAAAADAEARAAVEKAPLPAEIRAIASAYYAWNEAAVAAPAVGDANVPENPQREHLRDELRAAIGVARQHLGEPTTFALLRTLRSYDAELFLDELEVRARQDQDRDRKELHRLSGALTDVLVRNGWLGPELEPHVPRAILRIRYKLHWTSIVFGLGDCDRDRVEVCYGLTTLPLETVETRTLLSYLVAHPVVRPEDLERRGNLQAATDARRLVYVDRLAELDRFADPTGQKHPFLGAYDYPLARGVMLFRAGFFLEAEALLRVVADARKDDGRAHNWYLAAVAKNHPGE
jgi:hypothetical protein